ncbi:hypothetical protein ON010_g1330 [Phytophthora cinnamomi]|nr:hypothetical protein ON010_g1330 [Phytophthora cinnamomi]
MDQAGASTVAPSLPPTTPSPDQDGVTPLQCGEAIIIFWIGFSTTFTIEYLLLQKSVEQMLPVTTTGNLFLSVEVRLGSWSDSKCWKHLVINSAGTHFIGTLGMRRFSGF